MKINQPKLLHSDQTGARMVVLAVGDGEHENNLLADRGRGVGASLASAHSAPALLAVAAGRVWRVFSGEARPWRSVYVDTQAADPSYVHALLGPAGLADPEFARWAVGESQRYASDLSASLRKRIHGTAMPALAEAAARDMRSHDPDANLDEAFQASVRVLFRLLLIAWGPRTRASCPMTATTPTAANR